MTTAEQVPGYIRLIVYRKSGNAVYIAHLDLMNTLFKAFRRARLPYAVTQGCHVRPKATFGPPLSLGQGSFDEWCLVHLTEDLAPETMIAQLQQTLPDGLQIVRVTGWQPGDFFPTQMTPMHMRITLIPQGNSVATLIHDFLADPEKQFSLPGKQGNKSFYIGATIRNLTQTIDNDGKIRLELEFHPGPSATPSFGKTMQGLLNHLGDRRHAIERIDRMSFLIPPATSLTKE